MKPTGQCTWRRQSDQSPPEVIQYILLFFTATISYIGGKQRLETKFLTTNIYNATIANDRLNRTNKHGKDTDMTMFNVLKVQVSLIIPPCLLSHLIYPEDVLNLLHVQAPSLTFVPLL